MGGGGSDGSNSGSNSGSPRHDPRQAVAGNSASGHGSPEARAALSMPEARVAAEIAAVRAAANYTALADSSRGSAYTSVVAAATPRPFSAAPGDRAGLDEPTAGGMRGAATSSRAADGGSAAQQQRPRPSTASHGMFHLFAGALTDPRPETAEVLYVGGAGWSREAPGSSAGAALLGCRASTSNSRPPSRPSNVLSVSRGAQGHRIMTTASMARQGVYNDRPGALPAATRGYSR